MPKRIRKRVFFIKSTIYSSFGHLSIIFGGGFNLPVTCWQIAATITKKVRLSMILSVMKMFNLINIGERAGSGVPNIFNTWEEQGWKEPVIEERFDSDRTVLSLEFIEKQAIKNKR